MNSMAFNRASKQMLNMQGQNYNNQAVLNALQRSQNKPGFPQSNVLSNLKTNSSVTIQVALLSALFNCTQDFYNNSLLL